MEISRIDQIATIIADKTLYTINKYPEIAQNGINLYPSVNNSGFSNNTVTEQYDLEILASTLDLLETYSDTVLKCDSNYPSGYRFSTANYPVYLSCNLKYRNYHDNFYQTIIEIEAMWVI
ncbi:hypothetical protein [Candidatus Lokiarchaeum ossiferum]|uniref:hypothetical protein n=1 Tax=Candidatus Lokiarchaeum ossiferum TaxID=2951803 RepID=UPI00352DE54F